MYTTFQFCKLNVHNFLKNVHYYVYSMYTIKKKNCRQISAFITLSSNISPPNYQGKGGGGYDFLIWQLTHSGVFNVCSFYNSLLEAPYVSFPQQSIYCVKLPKMVSFFFGTAARGEILTIDILVKKKLRLVNLCCLCQCDEETVDHLLLHCKLAHEMWSEVFLMFRV